MQPYGELPTDALPVRLIGLSYTLNQFHYNRDDDYNSNRLPVIPQHFGSVHVTISTHPVCI